MNSLFLFLNDENDVEKIIFPAATVLLDLTANESFVEDVAKFLYEKSMFGYIFDKIKNLLDFSDRETDTIYDDPMIFELEAYGEEFMDKLRDLFLGIILNLSCNIED